MAITLATERGLDMERKHLEQASEIFHKYLPYRRLLDGLIEKADEVDDLHHNTDMSLHKDLNISLSFRVRNHDNYERGYGGEITFRCKSKYGGRTEWDKMMSGYGDFFLYGFESEDGEKIDKWVIIDLEELRRWSRKYLNSNGVYPGQVWDNGDGTGFRALRLEDLPNRCVIASHNPVLD